MKRKWFGVAAVVLTLVAAVGFSGCMSPPANRQQSETGTPMAESCVIKIPDGRFWDRIYGDFEIVVEETYEDYSQVYYQFKNDDYYQLYVDQMNIVPAGYNKLLFVQEYRNVTGRVATATEVTTTFEITNDYWVTEYEFLPGKVYAFELLPNHEIEVIEESTFGSVYVQPVALPNFGIEGGNGPGLLASKTELGPGFRLGLSGGPSLGLQIFSDPFDMTLKAVASGFFALALAGETGLNYGFSYGGMAGFAINPNVSFGLGGGMVNGWFVGSQPTPPSYTMPYAEFTVGVMTYVPDYSDAGLTQVGIFGRYYFSDPGYWGVGLKIQ